VPLDERTGENELEHEEDDEHDDDEEDKIFSGAEDGLVDVGSGTWTRRDL